MHDIRTSHEFYTDVLNLLTDHIDYVTKKEVQKITSLRSKLIKNLLVEIEAYLNLQEEKMTKSIFTLLGIAETEKDETSVREFQLELEMRKIKGLISHDLAKKLHEYSESLIVETTNEQ